MFGPFRYEEDNFIRLTLSKADKAKHKLREQAARGMLVRPKNRPTHRPTSPAPDF
jgi:hypothetical protein